MLILSNYTLDTWESPLCLSTSGAGELTSARQPVPFLPSSGPQCLFFCWTECFLSKPSPRVPPRYQETAIDPWVLARQPEMGAPIRITVTAEMNGVPAMGQALGQVLRFSQLTC